MTHAPVHVMGHYSDRWDVAKLQTTSARLTTSMRNVIRARNERLPPEKQMAKELLAGPFCVAIVLKELLRREGRQPPDFISTGGEDQNQRSLTTVISLDLFTQRFTTLPPMLTAHQWHGAVVSGRKLYVMSGVNNGPRHGPLTCAECFDFDTEVWPP